MKKKMFIKQQLPTPPEKILYEKYFSILVEPDRKLVEWNEKIYLWPYKNKAETVDPELYPEVQGNHLIKLKDLLKNLPKFNLDELYLELIWAGWGGGWDVCLSSIRKIENPSYEKEYAGWEKSKEIEIKNNQLKQKEKKEHLSELLKQQEQLQLELKKIQAAIKKL